MSNFLLSLKTAEKVYFMIVPEFFMLKFAGSFYHKTSFKNSCRSWLIPSGMSLQAIFKLYMALFIKFQYSETTYKDYYKNLIQCTARYLQQSVGTSNISIISAPSFRLQKHSAYPSKHSLTTR